jgi:hypothetical protein
MKRASIPKRSVNSEKISLPQPRDGYALNVCFLYQDAATKKWAKEVAERVAQQTGVESMRSTWWKMTDLSASGVLAGAVSIALRADVIVVAMDAAQGLPYPFYAWVESWLPHRFQPAGSLVVLMGNTEAAGTRASNIREYLRAVAHLGRMDFSLEERVLPAVDPDALLEANLETGHRMNDNRVKGNGVRKRFPALVLLPEAS